MFAEFEKITHEQVEAGKPLTADDFTVIYYGLNKKYYGNSTNVDELIGIEWARIPHFYSNFYVYKYATGFSAASALSSQILKEGKPAVDRYIEFLKSGGSEYPLDQLRRAGVDMEKKESVEKALDVFAGNSTNVDELIGIEWARIPHFYSNVYVYKYATGFSAASALSSQMVKEGKPAVDRSIEFWKSGGSEYPLDQLRRAGVDMEKKESVEKSLDVFAELVVKLEAEII